VLALSVVGCGDESPGLRGEPGNLAGFSVPCDVVAHWEAALLVNEAGHPAEVVRIKLLDATRGLTLDSANAYRADRGLQDESRADTPAVGLRVAPSANGDPWHLVLDLRTPCPTKASKGHGFPVYIAKGVQISYRLDGDDRTLTVRSEMEWPSSPRGAD
jgi:hypothetical protein